jgi:uncharacterized protein YutE (UPF0331/DUF86 family)/predicted nucleotidyltransferase
MRRGRLPEIEIPAPSRDAMIRAVDIPEVIGAYLVGSWAAGRADALSDVDIAVWVDPDVPPVRFPELLDRLQARLEEALPGHEIDLILLNTLPPARQFAVLKERELLFCRDPGRCADWEARAMRAYLDESPFRELLNRTSLKRWKGESSVIDRDLLMDRMTRLEEFLALLEPLAALDRSDFCGDPYRYGSAERFLQLAIEAALDIGHHLIAHMGLGRPQSYAEVFRILGRAGILPEALAEAMAQMARWRNRLVHLYWDIDHAQVHAMLPQAIRDLKAFMQVTARLIEGTSAP